MDDLCTRMKSLFDDDCIESEANKQLKPLNFKCILIQDEDSLDAMTEKIFSETAKGKSVNVDFEGVDLCRHGKICLGQFHISESDLVYVVDFIAFDPFEAADGKLKEILESEDILKIFYDPRNDADALANLHNVHMNNALCLQVCEVAYRKFNLKLRANFVMGLQKAMDEYVEGLGFVGKQTMLQIKKKGKRLFAPEFGGSYEVFVERPLAKELLAYSAVDVFFMDNLKKTLHDSLPSRIRDLVKKVSEQRLVEHKKEGYSPYGRERARSPKF
jgi:exonuclease 3'-5' domain-containing protein 1